MRNNILMSKVIFLVTENEGQDVNIYLLNEHSGETSGYAETGNKSLISYKNSHRPVFYPNPKP